MRRSKYKAVKKKLSLLLLFFLTLLASVSLFSLVESRLLPSLQELAYLKAMAVGNSILDECMSSALDEIPLSAEELIILSDSEGKSYIADTKIINRLSAVLNEKINNALKDISKEKIYIPLGAALGSPLFSNTGPDIPFTVMPAGGVSSDYETDFISAGINQINYKIWITVSMEVKIVNPLYEEKIVLSKKIMLVDMLISGKVPDHYIGIE